LKNITKTNSIISDIREIVKNEPYEKRLSKDIKNKILQRIKAEKGLVDYITLSSSLLFSGQHVNSYELLAKRTMYNNVKKNDYKPANGYLDGIDVVCLDYRELFSKYSNTPNVVFLFDPPYLSTDIGSYNSSYWRLRDYLNVLQLLTGQSYFYFTSNKSNLIELCEWIEVDLKAENPLKGAVKKEIASKINSGAGYIDMMFYKNLNSN
jgi:site-specific DNA-adenine methylase